VSSAGTHVFSEPELVELLAAEPELLAVADAIAETYRKRQRSPKRLTAAAVAVAVVGAMVVAAPWRGGNAPSLADRAFAAVGSGPVVHAVLAHEDGPALVSVDLKTGRERPLVTSTEIWFDQKRGLEHTIVRLEGRLQDEMLQTRRDLITPRGAYRSRGNPWIDPALGEFVDGYRRALRTGRATPAGDGSVDGRPVTWFSFALEHNGTQRVAIDKQTSLPLRVETRWGGPPSSYAVREIETLPEGSGDFTAPRVLAGPEPDSYMRVPVPIAPRAATRVIPGAVALGSSFGGLRLGKVVETTLSTVFKPAARRNPLVSKGLEFVYGSDSLVGGGTYVWIVEATEPHPQNDWPAALVSARGTLVVAPRWLSGTGRGWIGLTVKDGLYVTILAWNRELMLAAARALRPFEPS
jgi:hypothetical protein